MQLNSIFSFSGKTTRSEYWGVTVLNLFATIMLGFVVGLLISLVGYALGFLLLLGLCVASSWVSLANAAKRCNDCGITPWWAAALFIPYINLIVVIVLGCLPTEE